MSPIKRSEDFDLGRDKTRMKDPRDGARQTETVDAILARFFERRITRRYPIQVLADEVGMGKTFVALATAYSILSAMRSGGSDDDLAGCYQKVLIITPPNQALFAKWQQETSEFVKRCVFRNEDDARQWFAPVAVKRIDTLSEELRTPGSRPRILVTTMGLFSGGKIRHYDVKRQLLLDALFRYWGTRFRYDQRKNLLKGAPAEWRYELTAEERAAVPFTEEEIYDALCRLARQEDIGKGLYDLEELLEICREIAVPYTRDRDELFGRVRKKLTVLYKAVAAELIRRDFPLIIVDEAHNWKNGPSLGSNGYREFQRFIACRSRRALLLTATPFQLRPEEMLEILKVSDDLVPAPARKDSALLTQRVEKLREGTIRPTLKNSADTSRRFAKEWSRLSWSTSRQDLSMWWQHQVFANARQELHAIATVDGEVDVGELRAIIKKAVSHVGPDLRPFLREALRLYAHNADLSQELGALVIRHRRRTEHRLFRVGREHSLPMTQVAARPDSHILHAAAGLDVRGDGELPHYVLMRCVSEMKKIKGKRGRSSLGSALTGCYTTLLHSAEGRNVQKWLTASPSAKTYLSLLLNMVGPEHDHEHPKLQPIAEQVLDNWQRGEKSLLFCFRVNTAERLQTIINEKIRTEMEKRASKCLGGKNSMRALRGRLTGRDRDLVVVGLDRVLWSLAWMDAENGQIAPETLALTDEDIRGLAGLSLRFGRPLTGERVDRVFLTRATEYVVAGRLLRGKRLSGHAQETLRHIHRIAWVMRPYGLEPEDEADAEGEEQHNFDERGVHSIYEEENDPSPDEIGKYADDLQSTRSRARRARQIPILDLYFEGPSPAPAPGI